MKKLLGLAALVVLLGLSGTALAADIKHPEFKEADIDNNGKISKKEFIRWYPVEIWAMADKNRDGYIVATEWVAVKEKLSDLKREDAAAKKMGNKLK